MLITLPVNISYEDWASQLVFDLNQYQVPIPTSENEWWDWASYIIEFNNFASCPLPSKQIFKEPSSWRNWACFFVEFARNL